ncbi:hypothetical protein [Leptolyngbya sp. 'hensonii']|uniref:hypothetical protein n=1 Tax=Leptolyngbya sp. 'hensonii' TaxID=1922337 RepID=UPI00118084ED|nr:hypothetical protein [Leptolyngbya sp. 'hensonii']
MKLVALVTPKKQGLSQTGIRPTTPIAQSLPVASPTLNPPPIFATQQVAQHPPVVTSPTATSPTPAWVPSPALTPVATPEPLSGNGVEKLFSQLATSSEPPDEISASPDLFANPTLFFAPDSLQAGQQPKLQPTILRTTWIEAKTPMQVYVDILVTQGQQSQFQVAEKGTYGGGTVYEVKQDHATWYFNLIPTKDLTGSIIVVWLQDPSQPVQ